LSSHLHTRKQYKQKTHIHTQTQNKQKTQTHEQRSKEIVCAETDGLPRAEHSAQRCAIKPAFVGMRHKRVEINADGACGGDAADGIQVRLWAFRFLFVFCLFVVCFLFVFVFVSVGLERLRRRRG
jgi:hypothetical protein